MLSVSERLIFLSGRLKPGIVFSRYARLARKQGFNRSYFILSFDCDTELDAEVAIQVNSRLKSIGIQPVYAVCGEVLEKGAGVYKQISNSGAEFINHGYRTHTKFNKINKTYESVLFYNKLSNEEIILDIRSGHNTYLSILGKSPSGFRTPHFGTFQNKDQLALMHRTIKDLGYTYSSSTMPLYGLFHGPLYTSNYGVYELAVGGWFDKPECVLDSWGFRYDPYRKVKEDDYIKQFKKIVDYFYKEKHPGLLNYYVDPSQIYDWEPFFECMELAAPMAIDSYSRLLREIN